MLNSILPILRINIGNLPIYTSAEIYKGTFDISSTNKSTANNWSIDNLESTLCVLNTHFISDTIYKVSSKMEFFS